VRADVGIPATPDRRGERGDRPGQVGAALIIGGEPRPRDRAIDKAVGEATQTPGPDGAEPDEVIHPAGELMSEVELERDLATPATQYAIVEDALAQADGIDRAALRRCLGELWFGFAAVAADNPTAWDRSAPSGRTIVATEGGNRMVADPYTRSLCSQWNVDAASALVLTSVEVADRLGVPPGQRIAVEATVESNLILPLPQRAELQRWPAFEVVAGALATHCGVPVDGGLGAEVVDLYACFPRRFRFRPALGLPLDAARLTVTGGMTFAGGPLNNAALASTVAVVERLRHLATAGGSARGLVTAISGMLTKPGAMMLSSSTSPTRFAALDVTDEATDRSPALPVDPDLAGEAVIVGATVITTFEGIRRAVAVVGSTASGGVRRRSVVTSDRDVVASSIAELGGAGRVVTLDGMGGFNLS
jgi:acetyl-CoA C-acetyltransferase